MSIYLEHCQIKNYNKNIYNKIDEHIFVTQQYYSHKNNQYDLVLDLHEKNHEESFNLVIRTINRAYENKDNKILIITGKGKDEPESLSNIVPRWLEYNPKICNLISSFNYSINKKGGKGAIEVKLKK